MNEPTFPAWIVGDEPVRLRDLTALRVEMSQTDEPIWIRDATDRRFRCFITIYGQVRMIETGD